MGNHIDIDYDALDVMPNHERFHEASKVLDQAWKAASEVYAYRDAVVADVMDSSPETDWVEAIEDVAQILGIRATQVADHLERHRQRMIEEQEYLGALSTHEETGEYWVSVEEAEDGWPVFRVEGQNWPTGFREGADFDDVLDKARYILEEKGWDPQMGGWWQGQIEPFEVHHLDVRPDRRTPEES